MTKKALGSQALGRAGGQEKLPHIQGQGQRLRMAGCDGAGTAERSYPTSEVRGSDERSYPVGAP